MKRQVGLALALLLLAVGMLLPTLALALGQGAIGSVVIEITPSSSQEDDSTGDNGTAGDTAGGTHADEAEGTGGDIAEEDEVEDGETESPPPEETPRPAMGSVERPDVRWTYSISMTTLQSEYNLLVNQDHLLAEDYAPQDLVKMTVKRATSADVYIRLEAASALNAMFDAAKEAGYTLYLKSGYRSYGTQKTSYSNRLASNNGKDDGVVAYPGASEHQTGLACDILNGDYAGRPRMTTDFSETEEAIWMKENCTAFGFILRYPDGKTDITGIIFEPWHFRYVGVDVAMYISRTGMTLEEYTEEWQKALADFEARGGNVEEQILYEYTRVSSGPEAFILDVFGEDGDAEVSLSF